jgi:putative transposase
MSYADLRRGRHSSPGMVYHVTTVTLNRRPVFLDLWAARRVARELATCQTEGLVDTLCHVLMPDHLHWLIQLRAGSLSLLMRRLKGRTSRALGGNLWQPNYHDHALRADEDLRATARYIVANPLRAGLVKRLGDYAHWDSIWLEETLSD